MKEQNPSRGVVNVQDRGAARILTNPDELAFFELFIGQARTTSEVATLRGMTLNAAYLKVRRLTAAGLVRVAYLEARAGRAVRHYQAVAEAFFVPFCLTTADSRETLVSQVHGYWQRRFTHSLVQAEVGLGEQGSVEWGTSIGLDEQGRVWSTFGPGFGLREDRLHDGSPAVLDVWCEVQLPVEEAKALQRELHALMLRIVQQAPSAHGKQHLIRLALTPSALQ